MANQIKNQSTTIEDGNRRETFGFATLIVVLLIVSILTTITNVVIIYKLRLIPGFEFFTFSGNNVIFHKDAYIDRIALANNKIDGLSTITGNIAIESGQSKLSVNRDGIQIESPHGFEVRSPTTGKVLYPFDFSSTPLSSIKTLSVPSGIHDVKMIRSPIDEDLNIVAKERIKIRGNEGVRIEGKHINIDSSGIFLSSLNSSIVLEGHSGVYLNMNLFRNQIVDNHSHLSGTKDLKMQFKLCVCGKNGRLFKIPIKDKSSSCADARFPQSENPCI